MCWTLWTMCWTLWRPKSIAFLSPALTLYLLFSYLVMSNSFSTPWTVAARLLGPWVFRGKNTGVGCWFLLQGIFPTQGSNLPLLHLLALAGGFFTAEPPVKPLCIHSLFHYFSRIVACISVGQTMFLELSENPFLLEPLCSGSLWDFNETSPR